MELPLLSTGKAAYQENLFPMKASLNARRVGRECRRCMRLRPSLLLRLCYRLC